jgi:hypothetical protein
MDNTKTTRQQRRAAERLARKQPAGGCTDRAELLRIAAALVETDNGISGITIIAPRSGCVDFVDGGLLRRGGRA